MSKKLIVLLSVASAVCIGVSIFFFGTPTGRTIIYGYDYALKKPAEKSYENKKKVEDTCRSYIASYEADKRAYYQYKDSESDLERSWAQGYKQRANSTAATYNEYFLKNSFVFEGNIPSDILSNLPYLE